MFIELEYHEIEIILKMLTRDFMEIGNPISINTFKNKLLNIYPVSRYLLPEIDYFEIVSYINTELAQTDSDSDLNSPRSVLAISPEYSDSD